MVSSYMGAYRREKESPSGFQRLDNENHTIGWGEPAQIAQAKIDKCCPVCSTTRENGFDLGIEPGTDEIFGGKCNNCGWSFAVGDID
jgi:hypothetical protein